MECFGKNSEDLINDDHPEIMTRNRTCTDKTFLIGMVSFIIILFGFLGYCMANGDLDRIIKGYDDCGNVCGKNNIKSDSEQFDCFGKNMEEKKYLLYATVEKYDPVKKNNYYNYHSVDTYVTKKCVKSCGDSQVDVLNRCFEGNISIRNFFQEISEDFQLCWKEIILLSLLAFILSVKMMILFRYKTAFLVWFVLITFTTICISVTTYVWIIFKSTDSNMDGAKYNTFLYLSIVTTVFTTILVLVILVMIKRISLIIQLFKESAKAIAAMPLLLFQPILTFLALLIILLCGFYTTMWIMSSGYLQKTSEQEVFKNDANPNSIQYVFSNIEVFTYWYNYIAILWMIQFTIGCQHLIVSGSVASWFFARNKEQLESPIKTSTMNLLRYHLGTVALGSLIITIVEIIKTIVRAIKSKLNERNSLLAWIFYCFLKYFLNLIEAFLKFFSRNAYIQTAIFGHSFCKGGTRAFKLMMNNIFKVFAINSVGDYVLTITKLLIVFTTVIIGLELFRYNEKIHHLWFPLIIIGCVSYFIAHCFMTVYEMAIDTIFLCFCEDCERNDGISRPYYMSRNLMQFVENSNKILNSKNWDNTDQHAWDNGPKRVLLQGS